VSLSEERNCAGHYRPTYLLDERITGNPLDDLHCRVSRNKEKKISRNTGTTELCTMQMVS
jgi:hypothetical protein